MAIKVGLLPRKVVPFSNPLVVCVRMGLPECCKVLLSRGADPNLLVKNGYHGTGIPILKLAVKSGNAEVLKVLCDHGAQPPAGHDLIAIAMGTDRPLPVLEVLLDRFPHLLSARHVERLSLTSVSSDVASYIFRKASELAVK